MERFKYKLIAAAMAVSVFAFTGCSSRSVGNNAGNAWDGYGTDYNYGSGYYNENGTGYGGYNSYNNGSDYRYGGSSSDGMYDYNDGYNTTYGPYGSGSNGVGSDYLAGNNGSSVLPYGTETTNTTANNGEMVN